MTLAGIYKIQSKTKPERIYIGSAINIDKRWRTHLSILRCKKHHSIKLQNHYNKYGESDLQFSVVVECSAVNLIKIEQLYIDYHDPYFNICKIAGSSLGMVHSINAKRKMSISGSNQSAAHKDKIRKYRIGKKWSNDIKTKIAESNRLSKNTKKGKEIMMRAWEKRRIKKQVA